MNWESLVIALPRFSRDTKRRFTGDRREGSEHDESDLSIANRNGVEGTRFLLEVTHLDTRNVRRLLAGVFVALAIASLGLVACGRAEITEEEGEFMTPTPSGAPGGPVGQPTETPVVGGEEMEKVEVDLEAQNDSGQDGTATLEADGDNTTVTIEIKAGADGGAQAAHIHAGTCDALGDIKYPLEKVENGMSTSTVDVKFDDLMSGDARVINVHKDASDTSDSVACGEFEAQNGEKKEMTPGGGTPGGATPSGTPKRGPGY